MNVTLEALVDEVVRVNRDVAGAVAGAVADGVGRLAAIVQDAVGRRR